MVSRAAAQGSHPEKHKVVVRTFTSKVMVSTDGNKGCIYKALYQDDPGGAIPKSVVNWAAKKAFPSMLDDLVRAASLDDKEMP